MKTLLLTLLALVSLLSGYAQGNHVFSGGELVDYSVMDITLSGGHTWTTDRSALPGYYSAVNTANFTGCSDALHINGYIKKYGNTAFIFPVGSGTDLRTIEMSAPFTSTDAYASAWIPGNPSLNLDFTAPFAGAHSVFAVTAPIVAVSTAGQWDWQVGDLGNLGTGTTGTGAGLTITVSIPDMTAFASASNLRLVGWNGTSWTDLSNTATATGNTENSTLTGTMVAGITAIAIGSVSWVLPLKLESFTATASSCDAILNWQSSNEINTDKFIVEQSTDNSNYVPVATIKAKGNNNLNTYSYTASQPSSLVYYRLKMMDTNGTFTYSNIVLCRTNCGVNEFMSIYPNPVIAGQTLYLSFGTGYKGNAVLIISTILGQKYFNAKEAVNPGTNLVAINIDRFAAGTYIVNLVTEQGERIGNVQKFIKQ